MAERILPVAILSSVLGGCARLTGHAGESGGNSATSEAGAAGAPYYSAADLGAGRCYGISSDGRIVGAIDDPWGTPFVIDATGNRATLPLYQSDPSTLPLAINSAGTIVGVAQLPRTGIVFQNGSWSSLSAPPGETWLAALDINDGGDIVGLGAIAVDAGGAGGGLHAFLQRAGQPTVDLGIADATIAHRISSAGHLVGLFETDAGATHAFLYGPSKGSWSDVGTLGGANSAAFAVNTRGDVVGVADTPDAAHHAFVYAAGTLRDLGTLGGDRSDARGIDDNGNIVGNSLLPDSGLPHPFLVVAGNLVDIVPTEGGAPAYAAARVETIANGVAVGWAIAADGSSHCLRWSIAP